MEEITAAIKDRMTAINIKNVVNLEKIKQFQLRNNQKILDKIGAIRNSESVLGELKKRQEYYHKTLEKRLRRLKRAFPSMNSERLSKFLNNEKKS